MPLTFPLCREVMADQKLLNMKDRIDWKVPTAVLTIMLLKTKFVTLALQVCATDKATETEVTKEFRKKFEPFDFTLE